jgi:hypothetical protein
MQFIYRVYLTGSKVVAPSRQMAQRANIDRLDRPRKYDNKLEMDFPENFNGILTNLWAY